MKGADHQPREINYLQLPAHQLYLNQIKCTASADWFYLLGREGGFVVPLDGRRLSRALHFAESSGDGNHLPSQKLRSSGSVSQGKPSLLPFSVSVSHSKAVVALHDSVPSFCSGTVSEQPLMLQAQILRHPQGQPWRISILEVNSMQRSFSLIVFIARNMRCHSGLVFRWAPLEKTLLTLPTVMALLGTLAPPCQILLH